MDLYGNLHNALFENSNISAVSLGDTYEVFYRIISRLLDMDDFSSSMLQEVKTRIDKGESFTGALNSAIDNSYPFAKAEYFKQAISYLKDDLQEAFDRAVTSSNPADSWNADVHYLAKNKTINWNGNEYTLDQLQSLIEKGDVA